MFKGYINKKSISNFGVLYFGKNSSDNYWM